MTIKRHKPTSPGRRQRTDLSYEELTKFKPEKSLVAKISRKAGRSKGRVSVRARQVGAKKLYRVVDFKRDKRNIPAKVAAVEYDPNRGANLALLYYKDGEKRYILAPQGLKVGDEVEAGEKVEIKVGNALPLKNIPLGTEIHNLELIPKRGGQMVRGAGTKAVITAKEEKYVLIKLPSREIRKVLGNCYATVGMVGNVDLKHIKLGKAGRKRYLGKRPKVRGVAMHPNAHPHGGGEGRSGVGMPSPKTPWGKKTLGKKTRKRKYTDKYIVKDRRVR